METDENTKTTSQETTDANDDLEDGEIETDDDEPIIVAEIPAPSKGQQNNDKLTTATKTLPLNPPVSPVKTDSSTKKSYKKKPEPVEDDWAGNIENAIAAALKKDGIEPPRPKFDRREESHPPEDPPKSKGRKRKKRENEREKSKKPKHGSGEAKAEVDSDIDDYEMLCIRGGSPPHPARVGPLDDVIQPLPPAPYYESDDSESSYDSFDADYRKSTFDDRDRRQGRRNRDRRQRSKRSGRGNEKRRNRKDSDGSDDGSRSHDNKRQLELCKFYLMECCAKKENCSYMHSDFPCKYYYLGMDCVYKGECKFSHGKPLTEQLRHILLKHIETAPKEILGNFRRISREHAIDMLNATHTKLCEEHGVENTMTPHTTPTATMTTTTASMKQLNRASSPQHKHTNNAAEQTTSTSGIPSLLDMVIKPPSISPHGKDKEKLNKNDKSRKSRWCGPTSNQVNTATPANATSLTSSTEALQAPRPTPSIQQNSTIVTPLMPSTASSFLSLQNLSGVITNEQIDKLSAMGIESLEQVSQLTVAQLNSIGLTISQINQIQLNALNLQKLGFINPEISANAVVPPLPMNPTLPPLPLSSTLPPPPASAPLFPDTGSLISQDVDMRFMTAPPLPIATTGQDTTTSTNVQLSTASSLSKAPSLTLADAGIASPEPTPNSGNNIQSMFGNSSLDSSQKDTFVEPSSSVSSSVVDYSQYLKDSHLDTEKTDFNDIALGYKDDDVLNEDEPELQIDESWDDDDNANNKRGFTSDDDKEDSQDISLVRESSPESSLPPLLPAVYDPKLLTQASHTNKVDVSSSVSSMMGVAAQSYLDMCGLIQDKVENETKSTRSPLRSISETREVRDPRLVRTQATKVEDMLSGSRSPSTPIRSKSKDTPKYSRTSIYDGTPKLAEEDDLYSSKWVDNDKRSSPDLACEMALKLPFKPVMTNYTPATEIDGSIASHAPIPYKIYEIEIITPDYTEIRRSVKVSDKTLDPRLRRIFCMKESAQVSGQEQFSQSEFLPQTSGLSKVEERVQVTSGPRLDPRRKRDNQDGFSSSSSTTTSASQNLDIRMLLQKSDWYKNLNSKYKIMVNQQLALISTELKKFHQDPSPNKVFDIQFILSNQYLQQILTNLGVFIDGNGEVQQVEAEMENDQLQMPPGFMGNIMNNPGNTGPLPLVAAPAPPMPLPLEFMRAPPPLNMPQRFMGNMNPFAGRFGDARPGLLGMAPGVGFNPFDSVGGRDNRDNKFHGSGGPGFDNNFGGDGPMFSGDGPMFGGDAPMFGNDGPMFSGGNKNFQQDSGNCGNYQDEEDNWDDLPAFGGGGSSSGGGGGGGGPMFSGGNKNFQQDSGNYQEEEDNWDDLPPFGGSSSGGGSGGGSSSGGGGSGSNNFQQDGGNNYQDEEEENWDDDLPNSNASNSNDMDSNRQQTNNKGNKNNRNNNNFRNQNNMRNKNTNDRWRGGGNSGRNSGGNRRMSNRGGRDRDARRDKKN